MFSHKTVHFALQEPGNNQIKVVYKILYDHLPKEKPLSYATDPLITVLKNAHIKDLNDTTIQVMTSSIPRVKHEQDLKKRQTRARWHYGIRSRSDPLEIMLEIYNALSRTPIVIIVNRNSNLKDLLQSSAFIPT